MKETEDDQSRVDKGIGRPSAGSTAPVSGGVSRQQLLKWAAQLVRIVCGAELATDVDRDVAEPVRRIALQMRDAGALVSDPPAPRDLRVTTFTPMLWVALSEDEKYAEYIRVRDVATSDPLAPPTRISMMLTDYADLLDLIAKYFNIADHAKYHRGFTVAEVRAESRRLVDSVVAGVEREP